MTDVSRAIYSGEWELSPGKGRVYIQGGKRTTIVLTDAEADAVCELLIERKRRKEKKMKTAIELYPQEKNDLWNTCIYESDYQPIVDAFGNIILQESDDDYQGSTWVLYQDNDKIGFLRFGWGSCSGCDALQACRSIEEIQELMDELWQSIMWFDTKAEAYKFFVEHDWEGDWDSRLEESQRFVEQAIGMMRNAEVE